MPDRVQLFHDVHRLPLMFLRQEYIYRRQDPPTHLYRSAEDLRTKNRMLTAAGCKDCGAILGKIEMLATIPPHRSYKTLKRKEKP